MCLTHMGAFCSCQPAYTLVQDEQREREGLAVGVHVHLQPAAANQKDRYEVVLRGWQEGRFVLADMPDTEGAVDTFKVGTEWVARYILSGKAFGFKTDVIRVQFHPKPLIFFGYPDSIEALTIRKYKRIGIFIIGSLARVAEDGTVQDSAECVVRDLSRGGCLIETDATLSVGDTIALTFVLPNGQPLKNIPGEVRNTRPAGEKRFTGGIMFPENGDQKQAIDSFFDHIDAES
ncbi:MAG: flagellar brake protein [Candidatus Hydrogenedentota bacterium]|nr:MAG: flagellar brake protein [Candidatus Hydrogenedentota bacterium]